MAAAGDRVPQGPLAFALLKSVGKKSKRGKMRTPRSVSVGRIPPEKTYKHRLRRLRAKEAAAPLRRSGLGRGVETFLLGHERA